jgi:hypothetical protein
MTLRLMIIEHNEGFKIEGLTITKQSGVAT